MIYSFGFLFVCEIQKGGEIVTKKQMRFIDEYLIDLNGAQAAIRAGYSAKTARQIADEILSKPDIQAEIQARIDAAHSEKIAEAAEVMQYLTSVMRGEMTDETLRFVGDGYQEKTNIEVSTKDRLKAAELLGKRYSLFTDKVNVNGTVPVVISGSGDLVD